MNGCKTCRSEHANVLMVRHKLILTTCLNSADRIARTYFELSVDKVNSRAKTNLHTRSLELLSNLLAGFYSAASEDNPGTRMGHCTSGFDSKAGISTWIKCARSVRCPSDADHEALLSMSGVNDCIGMCESIQDASPVMSAVLPVRSTPLRACRAVVPDPSVGAMTAAIKELLPVGCSCASGRWWLQSIALKLASGLGKPCHIIAWCTT